MSLDLTAPLSFWMPTVWYGGYLPGLPDLLVGRWPEGVAREGQWKIWIVENAVERRGLTEALGRPVPLSNGQLDFLAGPDRWVRKSGSGNAVLALYAPPEAGWPWITIGRWPRAIGAAMGGLARGVYSTETDETESAALDRAARLHRMGGGMLPIVSPDHRRSGH